MSARSLLPRKVTYAQVQKMRSQKTSIINCTIFYPVDLNPNLAEFGQQPHGLLQVVFLHAACSCASFETCTAPHVRNDYGEVIQKEKN